MKLSGTLEKLKTINLTSSDMAKLEISGNTCPNLEMLGFYCTTQLTSLKLSGTLQNLKFINLAYSAITELEISGDMCPNLEILNLAKTKKLNCLKLFGSLLNLKSIDLKRSSIEEVEVACGCCPNLQSTDPRIKIINHKSNRNDNPIKKKNRPNNYKEDSDQDKVGGVTCTLL